MFPQFKKLNNESGIILFIVLMVSIIIMIFSLGILTQSLNETNYAQQQIDQIASDELAKGIFWNAYASNALNAASSQGSIGTVTLVNRSYDMNLDYHGNTANNALKWSATVNYDTFQ